MDGEKILEVANLYRKLFKIGGVYPNISPICRRKIPTSFREAMVILDQRKLQRKGVYLKEYPYDRAPLSKEDILCHCRTMIIKAREFAKNGKERKSLRWLGFVAGCIYRIDKQPKNQKNHEMISRRALWSNSCALLPIIEALVKEGNLDKAFWSLGWVQGILWSTGFYTIEELMNHNKPVEEFNKEK